MNISTTGKETTWHLQNRRQPDFIATAEVTYAVKQNIAANSP